MTRKVHCIMLIDDNEADNYFHGLVIKRNHCADIVIVKESGEEALEYLRHAQEKGDPNPDLIFLDINMPRMSGWQFLEQYNRLDKELQGKVIVVMLTTHENPRDKTKATLAGSPIRYRTKPLTIEMFNEVFDQHFARGQDQSLI